MCRDTCFADLRIRGRCACGDGSEKEQVVADTKQANGIGEAPLTPRAREIKSVLEKIITGRIQERGFPACACKEDEVSMALFGLPLADMDLGEERKNGGQQAK
jgi:hypothetical protein